MIVKTVLIYALQTLIQIQKATWTSSYKSTYKETNFRESVIQFGWKYQSDMEKQ